MNCKSILLILTFFLSILIVMVPTGVGEHDNVCIEDIKSFIESDPTNINAIIHEISPQDASYMLAENADNAGIDLGCIRFYNFTSNRGYWFCYHKLSNGTVIYIDPKTDMIYTYDQALERRKDIVLTDYSYFYYYPYEIVSGAVEAPYWIKEEYNLIQFLKSDQTNIAAKGNNMRPEVAGYYLARNASAKNISLGIVRLYHDEPGINIGYWFCYTKTSLGIWLFIDPKTDIVCTFIQARDRRIHHDLDLCYATYYHYYPFVYSEGSCEAPQYLQDMHK